ncbi:MAG TPA: hypothetical protein DCP31_37725 [Cyanobacteria bacterium UBA8543]|nr:hypothetical protein [Cyanobacteria bacterium UBA8543]
MDDIKLNNLGDKLVEAIPELQPQYLAELEWWGEDKPGVHIIFGDILNPYLISIINTDYQQESLIRIFDFLEKLANHENKQIQEVVALTVCERLGDEPEILLKARQYMGRKTLEMSHEIERFWGREVA